ncbi:ectoine/hydroxyectoine ABC transporter permease subunit EhuD [Caldalkalibacillus salinus]|uniref:ectoine/hydroxyectoine ABC transporter permease subunit EhuD n=1 Tax=Caldalkalibacillus salinus TaxID=2803787 RepID=UPI0019228A22|nr:ectoine/hydroxyectoine ABC transporter permease subunit EhuD [Caldalkalibacillus salinus]
MDRDKLWNWEYAFEVFPLIFDAIWITFSATILGFILAAIVGLILALGRRSKQAVIRYPVIGFIEFIRSTPLLVQLFFIFFALPQIPVIGLTLEPMVAGVIGLGLHYSTYLSEIYRSGIDSIAKGQWEASTSLNFSRYHTWTKVILPQAIPPVIPMFGNYLIVMFKETPMLMSISVAEMMYVAQTLGSAQWRYIEPITIVGLLFLALSYPSAYLVRRLEARMGQRFSKKKKLTREEVTM